MSPAVTNEVEVGGDQLVYDEYGEGARTLVLLHGLLLTRKMHSPLAEALAERGHRVICLDLLGHGDSDKPIEMGRYSMPAYGGQVVEFLEAAGLEEVVLGGTSLGANVSLEAAAIDRSRLRGLLIEMPVLDNALLACAMAFTPLAVWLTFGEPAARAVAAVAQRVPRGALHLGDTILDWIGQDPKPAASVLHGLLYGRTAPPSEERRSIDTPALVIGHPRDPIHPFSDSGMLVDEMPNATLLEARSILELRLRPDRLTDEIAVFLDRCWRPRKARPRKAA